MTDDTIWTDASTATYTAEATTIDGHTITVCLDDEGPLRPAFYWDITQPDGTRIFDGWAPTTEQARTDALHTWKELKP